MRDNQQLSFRDGFNFGCGFWVAAFIFFVVFIPLTSFFIVAMLTIFVGSLEQLLGG